MQGLDLTVILIRVLVVTFSLSVHEFAHAYVANRLGDDTAALSGRLTLNPLAHLDPLGVLAFIIARIGWARPVPVNPNRFRNIKSKNAGMALVSLAGPVSNFLLATAACFLTYLLIWLKIDGAPFLSIIMSILLSFFYSNIYLGIFNLLPVPPLDGYRVIGSALPSEITHFLYRYERYIGMIFLALIWFGGGIIGKVMGIFANPLIYVISKPISLLFGLPPIG